jgi:hypothetical protein
MEREEAPEGQISIAVGKTHRIKLKNESYEN